MGDAVEASAEPASALPLRWGRYGDRVGWALLLIMGGTIALAGADTFQLLILLVGTAACMTGWGILPADGWRRLVVAVPGTLTGWLMLGGPRFIGVLVVPYLCWLLVRHRPALAWLTALLPIVAAAVIAQVITEYRGMLIAVGIEGVACLGAALLARRIARRLPSRSPASPA